MASSSVKKEVKAAAAQFREETSTTLAAHDQRLDRLEYRATRTEARVDALLQFSNLVAEGSEKLDALWVENVEGGKGYVPVKQGAAEALAQEVVEHVGMPWPLTPPTGVAGGAPSEEAMAKYRLLETFVGCIRKTVIVNVHAQWVRGVRNKTFIVHFRPDLSCYEFHRSLLSGVDRLLNLASGVPFRQELPTAVMDGVARRRFMLYPEKTAAQRARRRSRTPNGPNGAGAAGPGGQAPLALTGASPASGSDAADAAPPPKGGKKGGKAKGKGKDKGGKGKGKSLK
jgi:hypothetical protein